MGISVWVWILFVLRLSGTSAILFSWRDSQPRGVGVVFMRVIVQVHVSTRSSQGLVLVSRRCWGRMGWACPILHTVLDREVSGALTCFVPRRASLTWVSQSPRVWPRLTAFHAHLTKTSRTYGTHGNSCNVQISPQRNVSPQFVKAGREG